MGGIGTNDDPLLNMMHENNMGGFARMFPQNMQGNVHVFQNGMPVHLNQFQKPESINKKIEITIEQAYSGCVLPIIIERWIQDKMTRRTETETTEKQHERHY